MHLRIALLVISLLLITLGTSCSNQCEQIRSDYDASLKASPFVENVEGLPIHAGVVLRTEFLNEVASVATERLMGDALSLTDQISIASNKSVSVKTEGKVIDFEISADPACENCVRIDGKLDGKVAVKVPMLPIQRAPLRGTLKLVAPLEFEREGNDAVLIIDGEKWAKLGKSDLNAEIARLPPTWSKILQGALSDKLLASLGKTVGRVKVFTIRAADLGIEGLQLIPAKIITDAKKKTIFAGFSTNLAAADASIEPTTLVKSTENAVFITHPSILVPAVEASMRSGKIDRRYTAKGKAKKDGPVYATFRSMTLNEADAEGVPFKFGLRLWNLPTDDKCYWVDMDANGHVSIKDNEVAVSMKDVDLTDSSLNGIVFAIVEWQNSEVLEASRQLLKKSISKERFNIPGGSISAKSARITTYKGALRLGAMLTVSGDAGGPPE